MTGDARVCALAGIAGDTKVRRKIRMVVDGKAGVRSTFTGRGT